ncbi:MAG: chemotaxis protein CheA [Candidatus Schekmanbacteria bacterium]|nr:chemotaxis protein CheA [Candidatus Schekmanbacteria bacterium]
MIDELSRNLAEIESAEEQNLIKPDLVNTIFRVMHSLKGLAGMLGYQIIANLSHELENLLDQTRLGRLAISRDLLDLLFDSLDVLNALVLNAAMPSDNPEPDLVPFRARIQALLAQKQEHDQKSVLAQLDLSNEVLDVLTEYEEHRLADNINRGAHIAMLNVTFSFDTFDEDLAAINEAFGEFGEVITTMPSLDSGPDNVIQFNLLVASRLDLGELESRFAAYRARLTSVQSRSSAAPPRAAVAAPAERPGEAADELGPLALELDEGPEMRAARPEVVARPGWEVAPPVRAAEVAEPASPAEAERRRADAAVGKTVRVDVERIDRLMNSVGELMLSKAELASLAARFRAERTNFSLADALHRASRQLERRLIQLQTDVLGVRMVPLDTVFSKLHRIVRQASRSTDKEVDLFVDGGATEIDKMIVEELLDPMVHIVRNAVDHGIETPNERIMEGKSPIGEVHIRAAQRGNSVEIAIEDDGKGIDPHKVWAKALEKGIVAGEIPASKKEVLALIFQPGFSTAAAVSELSGRGVGMDVVRNRIAELNGMIDIDTEVGRGTRLTLTLPSSLAIISVLLVRAAGEVFALPLTNIVENQRVLADRVRLVEGQEVLLLRDRTLPLVRLARVLCLNGDVPGVPRFVVIVRSAAQWLGLLVDELVGQREIVIKGLGRRLAPTPGVAGAAELGNFQTVLVLDIRAIVAEVTAGQDSAKEARRS